METLDTNFYSVEKEKCKQKLKSYFKFYENYFLFIRYIRKVSRYLYCKWHNKLNSEEHLLIIFLKKTVF